MSSPPDPSRPRAFLTGLAGPTLTAAERAFLAEKQPLGLILFARNIETPDQVRALTADARKALGRSDAPVLVDQEGGRVARLRPPHWHELPAAARLAALSDAARAGEAAWLVGRLIASDCQPLGIDVVCAPVLDVLDPAARTDVIGDRAYGSDPATVARLGGAMADGLMAGGVLPVAKHIPGHGRAHLDSHFALPSVDAAHDALSARDFAPFRELCHLPFAMTAHIDYTALDPGVAATCSAKVVGEVVRGEIGFDGFLLSDDLSMQALGGDLGQRARASLAAGCDAVLHCNGDMAEMRAVADAAMPLCDAAWQRWQRIRRPRPDDFDPAAGMARLRQLLNESV